VGPTNWCTLGKTVIAWFWCLGSSLEKVVHLHIAQEEREAKGGDAPFIYVQVIHKICELGI
jgi:hypothetical protein